MPGLKYLYRVLYIAFLNKLLINLFNEPYYQESYILIIEYNSVVTVAECLDGSFESQSILEKAQHRGGSRGRTRRAPPLKLEKNMIFWRKIVIFHTEYPKIFAPPSARRHFLKVRPPP